MESKYDNEAASVYQLFYLATIFSNLNIQKQCSRITLKNFIKQKKARQTITYLILK